jgi:hypothetical protein
MQDNNLPNTNSADPIHVDDYQPPQSMTPPGDQPFSAPVAPSFGQDDNTDNGDEVKSEGIDVTPSQTVSMDDQLGALSEIIDQVKAEKKELDLPTLEVGKFISPTDAPVSQPEVNDIQPNETPVIGSNASIDDQLGALSEIIDQAKDEKKELDLPTLEVGKSVSPTNDPVFQPEVNDTQFNEASVGGNNVSGDSPVSQNQSLETQNIFDLLGVSDGKAEEKEAFLDELQEVIWEDFIENDTGLLLNEEQQAKLKEIQDKGQTPEVQEEMLVYLEKLLPDLEDMMMDKALELKEDMVLERISGMKEFYGQNQDALSKIGQAEELISQNKWADAGNLLNKIK